MSACTSLALPACLAEAQCGFCSTAGGGVCLPGTAAGPTADSSCEGHYIWGALVVENHKQAAPWPPFPPYPPSPPPASTPSTDRDEAHATLATRTEAQLVLMPEPEPLQPAVTPLMDSLDSASPPTDYAEASPMPSPEHRMWQQLPPQEDKEGQRKMLLANGPPCLGDGCLSAHRPTPTSPPKHPGDPLAVRDFVMKMAAKDGLRSRYTPPEMQLPRPSPEAADRGHRG